MRQLIILPKVLHKLSLILVEDYLEGMFPALQDQVEAVGTAEEVEATTLDVTEKRDMTEDVAFLTLNY